MSTNAPGEADAAGLGATPGKPVFLEEGQA